VPDSATPRVVVDIRVTATQSTPAQAVAWARLWGILLANEQKSPAPAATGTGLKCARVLDAPMDHPAEVLDDPNI
jgi:hypothetical protein